MVFLSLFLIDNYIVVLVCFFELPFSFLKRKNKVKIEFLGSVLS